MEESLLGAMKKGLGPNETLESSGTRFYSDAKAPLHCLSNLYGCECKIGENTFPSAEHAYQALHKMNGDLSKWEVGGDYSNWDKVYSIINKDRTNNGLKPLKPEKWKKKNQVGIMAILVIRRSELFDLSWKPRDDALSVSYKKRWRPIFEAKYASDELRNILLSTRGPLIEFKRGGHKTTLKAFEEHLARGVSPEEANKRARERGELWGAFNYEREIKRKSKLEEIPDPLKLTVWGENTTGKNLSRYRDELLLNNLDTHEDTKPASKKSRYK